MADCGLWQRMQILRPSQCKMPFNWATGACVRGRYDAEITDGAPREANSQFRRTQYQGFLCWNRLPLYQLISSLRYSKWRFRPKYDLIKGPSQQSNTCSVDSLWRRTASARFIIFIYLFIFSFSGLLALLSWFADCGVVRVRVRVRGFFLARIVAVAVFPARPHRKNIKVRSVAKESNYGT